LLDLLPWKPDVSRWLAVVFDFEHSMRRKGNEVHDPWPEEMSSMANRSYLCVTNRETLYPNIGDPDYDPAQHTVAACAYAVPLLWVAMFRLDNMRTQMFEVEGQSIEGVGPLAKKNAALKQLREAVPLLNRMFAVAGPLDEHAELLRQGVEQAPGLFVTIEMEEIAGLSSPKDFYGALDDVLECFEVDEPTETHRKRVRAWVGLKKGQRLPSARCFAESKEVSKEDAQTHARLLGFDWIRPTPW
jgi:hypothetical protein